MEINNKINELKSCANAAIHSMENHQIEYLPKNKELDVIIVKMHNAQDKEQLRQSYLDYIQQCKICGYGDGSIIAGIMQNKEQNEKFNVNIDKVFESYAKWITDPLYGLSEEEIRKYASQYNPNEISANAFGSTQQDILCGDLTGSRAAKRKAAHEWVNNIANSSLETIFTIFDNDDNESIEKTTKINEKPEISEVVKKENTVDTVNLSDNSTFQTFTVNNKCEGCGMCYAQFGEYFTELEDGKAKANSAVYNLDENQLKNVKKVCPYEAIDISVQKPFTKQGFITELEKLKNYVVRYPDRNTLKFDKSEYDISIPVASGERRYEYTSYEAAQRAAGREIDSKMYSQIDIIILKIITEYRTKYLKPYYSKSTEDNSFFAKCNQEVSELLNRLASILKNNNLVIDLPVNFAHIDIFPEKDIYWKMLSKGEIMSDEMISTVKGEFKSNSFSDLERYICYCDFDEMDRIVGTDRHGYTKTKEKYCYRNMYKAFQELANDLLNSCGYVHEEIENKAMDIIGALIDEYNKLLIDILDSKIVYLDSKLDLIPDDDAKSELDKYENTIRRIGYDPEEGFYLNGEKITGDAKEVYVTESNGCQYFYDGAILRKKYISDGIVHWDTLFSNRHFEYVQLCGYDGYILFVDRRKNRTLYIYNSNIDKLEILDSNLLFCYFKNDYFIYVKVSNINNYDRYSTHTICCCKINGTCKRTVFVSYGGQVLIKNITDTELTYTTIQNYKETTIVWKTDDNQTTRGVTMDSANGVSDVMRRFFNSSPKE